MVGMQYDEGEKMSCGGGVSREAMQALGEDGVEVALGCSKLGKQRPAVWAWGMAALLGQLASPILKTVLPWGRLPALKRKLGLTPSQWNNPTCMLA